MRKSKEITRDAQYYFDRGQEAMKKKDYVKAIGDFQTVVESFSESEIVPHAQFMLAEAHFKSEEYITASFEYERVYIDYPASDWAMDAQFKKALCYFMESPSARLDQGNTNLAIDEFNRFIDNYPNSELTEEAQKNIAELRAKMAYKEYLNGETYEKLKYFEAATIYYQYIIDTYPRTLWAEYARFGIAEVQFKMDEYEKAKSTLMPLLNRDIEKDLRNKIVSLMDDIEEIEAK